MTVGGALLMGTVGSAILVILCLPLLLARLADAFGIRGAHGLVMVLLAAAYALVRGARRVAAAAGRPA